MDIQTPARFLETAFHDDDHIVIAYRRLPSKDWFHRFLLAREARAPRFLAWLRHLNATQHDIYVSMNTFGPRQHGRTEANIVAVRHIYAEFDGGGQTALNALRARADLPPLSYVIHSSNGKFQAIWNAGQFELAQAKRLLRHLAYMPGADNAVHDLSRVLRLPGFFNYKYPTPPFVRLEIGCLDHVYTPADFPTPPEADDHRDRSTPRTSTRTQPGAPGSPRAGSASEHDWAFVRAGLARGEPWHTLWATLLRRRQDKSNPRYYAALTLLKALQSRRAPPPCELLAELHAAQQRIPGPLRLPPLDNRG